MRASVPALATAVAISAFLPAPSGARPAADAGAASTSSRLTAAADATVDSRKPRRSAGKAKTLRAGGRYRAFVRFTVPAGDAVEKATLRVFALGAAPKGFDARGTGAGWSERTLTSRTAPRAGSPLDRSGAVRANRWIELDVTAAVRRAGPVAFVLTGAKPVALGAREDAKHAPQLVLTRAEPPVTVTVDQPPTVSATPAPAAGATPVPNRAPAVTAAAGQTATEAGAKSFALGTFADGDGPSPWSVDVDWGDGTPHTTFTASATGALPARPHTYANDGARTVTVKVTDGAGASSSASFAVAVAKAAPTVTMAAANALDADEGDELTYQYAVTGDGADAVQSVVTSCGAAGVKVPNSDATGSFRCRFPEGPAESVVSALATDSGGDTRTGTQTVDVANVAPTAHFERDEDSVPEQLEATFSFTDAADASAADAAELRYEYSCDDPFDAAPDYENATEDASTACSFVGVGTHTVHARVVDPDGGATAYTSEIDVTQGNQAPELADDVAEVDAGASVLIDVLANDDDPDAADTLTIQDPPGTPEHGTAEVEDGKIRYTPDDGFTGLDRFVYEACDDGNPSLCPAANVDITVNAPVVNQPPVTSHDDATVTEDGDVLIDVLGNDDPGDEGQTLAVSRITVDPEHGRADIEDGGVRYTPDADYHGEDFFTYEACDDAASVLCDTATVSIDVEAVNDAPVTARHEVVVDGDGDMLLDPAGDDSAGPQEPGQTLTLTEVRPPSYGVATKTADGRVHYLSRTGHGGPDWFDYEVCDDATPQECTTGTVHLWIPTVRTVHAQAETDPLPGEQSYAEGVAIWRNDAAPSDSAVIVADRANESSGGTLVDGGLGVYGLDGSQTDYEAGGNPSTVDVRSGFAFPEGEAPIVAAGDRPDDAQGHDRLRFYSLDPATRALTPRGVYGDNAGVEVVDAVAGTCLWHAQDGIHIFVTHVNGSVQRGRLAWRPTPNEVRPLSLLTVAQATSDRAGSSACTVDDANSSLYVVQDGQGVWRFAIDPDTGNLEPPTLIDSVGNDGHLSDGVESVAVARGATADAGYLVAATQGGDHYVLYTREGEYVRTVRIGAHGGIDGTSSLGIAAMGESMLPEFPDGMLLAGDKDNTGEDDVPLNPNAKLVDLAQVSEDRPGEDAPQFPERDANCTRPYTADSPWNTPIGADPVYDAASALHVAAIGGSLSSDPDQFTYPVYEVDENTPLVPVALGGTFSEVTGDGSTLTRTTGPMTLNLPIPAGAGPSAGDDSQIILHDSATGTEWGLFELFKNDQGEWEATNGYVYNTAWSAVPPSGFGSRGAGVPYLTGLVRPCEIARGHIDHALAFAYDDPTPQWVYPATKSDGHSLSPADMPEGARLQLDPDLSEQDIIDLGCTGPCLTIARAMQQYGMYLIDHAGHPKVMLEYRDTAEWSPAVDSRTVRPIPTNQLELLELGQLQGP